MQNVLSEPNHSSSLNVPIWVNYLEYIIDKLFISSFILNKIKDFPLGPASMLLGNIALFCIALAYTLQLMTTNYYQVEKQQNQTDLNYQEICMIIALIGSSASWFCIFNPHLWLPCFWIMCLNNLLWIYNETTRIDNPSLYPSTPQNQEKYCEYVILMTTAMFSSALANTLGLFIPYEKQTILMFGKLCNWALSILGVIALYASAEPKLSDMNQPKHLNV